MYSINISDNIARLRRERKITQEQLAEFVGVTKASVSKWETGQSIPDVLMLPQLATFFDVSIDQLLGYEPQLSEEQILKVYRDLCAAFAKEPFEDVIKKSKKLVNQYYSCYSFLFRICLLWMNHYMLAKEEKRQKEILTEALELCEHITNNNKVFSLCNDVVELTATIHLMLGDSKAVIDELKEIQTHSRIANQSLRILIKAYQIGDEPKKADLYSQIGMYSQIVGLVGHATQFLSIHSDDLATCQETIDRIEVLEKTYHIEYLNVNYMCVFYYQAALVYCIHGKAEQALLMLTKFTSCLEAAFKEGNVSLRGDAYFNQLDNWFEQLEYGGGAPRDWSIVLESAIEELNHPGFSILQTEEAFKQLKTRLLRLLNSKS